MGEIDTKSIESVQAALFLFGEKSNHRKCRLTGNEGKVEVDEKELDLFLKDLSSYKVQLEVKESAYQQAILKLELYHKTVDELSTQLMNCEAHRDKEIEECRTTKMQIGELQSQIKVMKSQLSETEKAQEKLLYAEKELTCVQEELQKAREELASVEESKLTAMAQIKCFETASAMENEMTKELLRHTAELKETIVLSKLSATEADKAKAKLLMEKETELKIAATVSTIKANEQLEDLKKQIEMMSDLQKELAEKTFLLRDVSKETLVEKTLLINSLQAELDEVADLRASSEKVASEAIISIKLLKVELEQMERTNSDFANYGLSMETEVKHLQLELDNANQEVFHAKNATDMLLSEIKKANIEIDELRDTEHNAQVEIAILKSELHKIRSKIAAAEAGEARANSTKLGLYLAVQQLAIEAQEAKSVIETWRSKFVNAKLGSSTRNLELAKDEEPKTEMRDQKLELNNVSPTKSGSELGALKEEHEAARIEIIRLRGVAEEAVNRALLAEKAKAALEDQLRKWRQEKQKIRAALASQKEKPGAKASRNTPKMHTKLYVPLGKLLEMEF